MKKINIPLVSSTFIALFATNSFAFDVSEVSNANKPFMSEFNKLDTAKSGDRYRQRGARRPLHRRPAGPPAGLQTGDGHAAGLGLDTIRSTRDHCILQHS